MEEIWFINQYAIPPDLPGGTRHYDFGVELTKAGYNVRIFSANVNYNQRKIVKDLGGMRWMGETINDVLFQWISTCSYKQNDWRRVLNMLNFSWNAYLAGLNQRTKPGVIIGSSPHLFAAVVGLQLARRLGARFMLELRDLWPQTLVDMTGISERHPVVCGLRMIEKYLYRHAEHIIVLAEGSIPYLVDRGVDREHITFLPNGVHPDHFIPGLEREEAREFYGFDRFTVIYAGAHGPANALHTILDAALHLKDKPQIEFVLVGDGPTKGELENTAWQMDLDNVRFMSPVSKKEIPDLLAAADAAVITLRDTKVFSYGVSPNKLFDYMAAGKPIICAVPGDMANMVERYRCGLTVPPEDGAKLAMRVQELANMSERELKEMGGRGQKVVHNYFSRPQLARQLIKLIS